MPAPKPDKGAGATPGGGGGSPSGAPFRTMVRRPWPRSWYAIRNLSLESEITGNLLRRRNSHFLKASVQSQCHSVSKNIPHSQSFDQVA